ncbi:MAG: hypothetical protein Q7S15_01620 [bacterium]|nr:hypothetical protein [bacterium]
MTASWDNFYSKTFLRVFPDYLLVQTKLMRDQAVRLADYPASKISVVGLPQYDRYFKKNGIIPRNQFIVGLGGDPGKKLLVFACSGKVTLTEDVEMIELLRRLIKNGTLPAMNVLVRPHPKRTFSESYMEKIRKEYGFLALTPARKLNVAGDPWEFDERAISLLTNSLAHADVVISTCTTLFIEAAIFDAPLIAIGFDAGRKLNYWNSSRRFFEWEHMADLKRTGGVFNVTSERELVEALRLYLNDRKLHHEGREKIVAEQAVFTDGQSVSKTVDVLRSVF